MTLIAVRVTSFRRSVSDTRRALWVLLSLFTVTSLGGFPVRESGRHQATAQQSPGVVSPIPAEGPLPRDRRAPSENAVSPGESVTFPAVHV